MVAAVVQRVAMARDLLLVVVALVNIVLAVARTEAAVQKKGST